MRLTRWRRRKGLRARAIVRDCCSGRSRCRSLLRNPVTNGWVTRGLASKRIDSGYVLRGGEPIQSSNCQGIGSSRTHRTWVGVASMPVSQPSLREPEVQPSKKSTTHRFIRSAITGEDVQKNSLSVHGNAVGSIAGSIRVSSTMVCSSFMLGTRQPVPGRDGGAMQYASASAGVLVIVENICCHLSCVLVSCTRDRQG